VRGAFGQVPFFQCLSPLNSDTSRCSLWALSHQAPPSSTASRRKGCRPRVGRRVTGQQAMARPGGRMNWRPPAERRHNASSCQPMPRTRRSSREDREWLHPSTDTRSQASGAVHARAQALPPSANGGGLAPRYPKSPMAQTQLALGQGREQFTRRATPGWERSSVVAEAAATAPFKQSLAKTGNGKLACRRLPQAGFAGAGQAEKTIMHGCWVLSKPAMIGPDVGSQTL